MTSTALTILTPEEQAYLDSLGSTNTGQFLGLPKLEINLQARDAEGNKQVIGAWHIANTDKYFDGPVTFRPIRWMYKLMKYTSVPGDEGSFVFAGETVYFDESWQAELIDSMGGIALGRKIGKEYSKEERLASKNAEGAARLYADIFGLVTFGDSEPTPCMFRTLGGKQMVMLNAFKSVPKDKRYSQYTYTIEAYQEETEDSKPNAKKYEKYWSIKVTPDMSKILPITPILAFDNEIMDFIKESNHKVFNSHKAALSALEEPEQDKGATAKVINVSPTNEAEDDIELPF